jgi:proteasome beta subunit
MALEQATNLANRLLMTAAEFDTATGGVRPEQGMFATIKILTREGIRTLPPEEHETYWGKAKQ